MQTTWKTALALGAATLISAPLIATSAAADPPARDIVSVEQISLNDGGVGLQALPGSWNHPDAWWGASAGSVYSRSLSGWVLDKAADGDCVRVRTTWYKNGVAKDTDYSPRACPQYNKDNFTEYAGGETGIPAFYPDAVRIITERV